MPSKDFAKFAPACLTLILPETSSHVVDNEQGSGTIAQLAHPFRKVLSWQLKVPENFLFLTNVLFIHLPRRLYLNKKGACSFNDKWKKKHQQHNIIHIYEDEECLN